MTDWPEQDAPWHCGQCVGGWDCAECHRLFSAPGDPPLLPCVVHPDGWEANRMTPLISEPADHIDMEDVKP